MVFEIYPHNQDLFFPIGIMDFLDPIARVVGFRKNIFAQIEADDADIVWSSSSLKDVKKVLVILSASRSGSSLLFSALRNLPGIYAPNGECVPFYKLNHFSSDLYVSDEVPKNMMAQAGSDLGFSRDLLSDCSKGTFKDQVSFQDILPKAYGMDLVLRFSLQWPQLSFSYGKFRDLFYQAWESYGRDHAMFDTEEFYLEFLGVLREEYPLINPFYYDIAPQKVRDKFPSLEIPQGPPNDMVMIEEPPFILVPPRREIDACDLSEKTLLLKSSVDCYRMDLIEALFPNAQIHIVHLTRNPLAAINGLYDGWIHRGFFSHNLKNILEENKQKGLCIQGYSDRFFWAQYWWNYDLPPGWQEYIGRSLEEVCAFQWWAANNAVEDYLVSKKRDYRRIKHEDIIGDPAGRIEKIKEIVSFASLDEALNHKFSAEDWPVVQATAPPQSFRWKEKATLLKPLLKGRRLDEMARRLGYDVECCQEWL